MHRLLLTARAANALILPVGITISEGTAIVLPGGTFDERKPGTAQTEAAAGPADLV